MSASRCSGSFRFTAVALIITFAALATVVLFGDRLLAIFGPEFTSAKLPIVILMACARAMFGPSVSLLTVIGAQRQNAALAVAALAVLAISNAVLAPPLRRARSGDIGRVSGLRTDALYLLVPARKVRLASLGAGLAEHAAGKLDGAVLLKLLFGLLGREQRGPEQPEDKGRNGQKGDGGANFAEM
jgi:hypothetical protein